MAAEWNTFPRTVLGIIIGHPWDPVGGSSFLMPHSKPFLNVHEILYKLQNRIQQKPELDVVKFGTTKTLLES